MSEFQAFDSLDDMFDAMAQAEEQANAGLVPEQIALRDDIENERYWLRPYPQAGVLIFGIAWSEGEVRQQEPQSAADMAANRRRGYLFGMAYSPIEPDGEPGDTHVSQVMPISEEAFSEASRCGWRAVVPDQLAALMLPEDVLAEKTTPTLVAEMKAWTESHG